MHGGLGQRRVIVCRHGAAGTLGQRVKALEGLLPHHQIAGQVVSAQRQGAQHIVIAPVARVVAQLQFGVAVGEGAAHEALRPHVVQKPGQAVKAFAQAIIFINPHRAAGQRRHARKWAGLPLRVDAHNRYRTPHTPHGARQHITLLARRPHFLHCAGLD